MIENFDIVIIGAGFLGLYAVHKFGKNIRLSASKRAAVLAVRGIGTVIPVPASILKASNIPTALMKSYSKSGNGQNISPRSLN